MMMSLLPFFQWCEASALGNAIRTSPWAFAVIESIHLLGLAAIGGAIGVFLAWLVGKVVTMIFFQTYLSVLAILFAIGVSGAVGVMSGLFPAWKAARLDPIEALRYE